MLTQVELNTAIWARVLFTFPLRDARVAAELIAVLALLRILNDHEADSAGEVLIKLRCCLL